MDRRSVTRDTTQHTRALSGGETVTAKKRVIAAAVVGVVLLAAGGTGYLLLRETDIPAENPVATASEKAVNETTAEGKTEEVSEQVTLLAGKPGSLGAPDGTALLTEAARKLLGSVEDVPQDVVDEEMLARAKKLVGGELDEEVDLEDYSWEALAHALAHKDERILLSKTMMGEGHYDDAIAMLKEIIAGEPDEDVASLAHLMMGIAMMGKEDRAGALAEFQLIIEKYPRSAAVIEAAKKISWCSFATGKITEGVEWAMALLEEDPNNMGASLAFWRLLSSPDTRFVSKEELQRRWEICMTAMNTVWKPVEAYDAALALAKSMVLVDRDKMFQMLQEVARHCPDPTIAACAKGELLDRFATWDPAEGIRLGEEILGSDADEAIKKQARRWMYYAYMAEGDVEQAKQMFEQVASDGWPDSLLGFIFDSGLRSGGLDEGDGAALISWLGELCGMEGAVGAEALRLMPIATSPWEVDDLFEGGSSTLLCTAGVLLAAGNYGLAEVVAASCLEQATGNDWMSQSSYMSAVEIVAKAKAAQGEYREAAEYLKGVLDGHAGMVAAAEFAISVPEYLRQGGYYDEALAGYQQVLEQYPNSVSAPRALYLMAETQRVELGDPAAAREIYELVVAQYPDSLYADQAMARLMAGGGT